MVRLSLLWTLCLFLSPLLVLQGLWVRRTAERLPEAVGSHAGGEGEYRILVMGDSVVAGVGVKETKDALPARLSQQISALRAKGVSWRSFGHNGDQLRDMLRRLPMIEGPAELVVVNIGVNDVTGLTSMMRWQLELTSLVAELTQRFRAPIVFLGLPPVHSFPLLPQPLRFALGVRARMLDHSLKRVGELVPSVTYIATDLPLDTADMAEDGYHPSVAIIDAWVLKIAARIQQENLI
jgi:hypothetical protein